MRYASLVAILLAGWVGAAVAQTVATGANGAVTYENPWAYWVDAHATEVTCSDGRTISGWPSSDPCGDTVLIVPDPPSASMREPGPEHRP